MLKLRTVKKILRTRTRTRKIVPARVQENVRTQKEEAPIELSEPEMNVSVCHLVSLHSDHSFIPLLIPKCSIFPKLQTQQSIAMQFEMDDIPAADNDPFDSEMNVSSFLSDVAAHRPFVLSCEIHIFHNSFNC